MNSNIDYDILINAAKTLDKDSLKLLLEKMFEISVEDISDENYASKCDKCSKVFKDECEHYNFFLIKISSNETVLEFNVDEDNVQDLRDSIHNNVIPIKFESGCTNGGVYVIFRKDCIDLDLGFNITIFKVGETEMKIIKQKIYDIIKFW